MLRHLYETRIVLPPPLEEVFAFFSDAGNLERITPPELKFEILTPLPLELRAGALIDYRLQLFGFPFRWRTRIARWDPPHSFIDEQVRGPYREWVHTHHFKENEAGTEMTDCVLYRLPFAPLGELAHPMVRKQVERIFRYRQERIRGLLLGERSS